MKWGGVSIDTSRIKNSDGSTIESRFQTVESSAGGGGGASGGIHVLTPPISGRIYSNFITSGTTSAQYAMGRNRLGLTPFQPAHQLDVSSFTINVTSGGAGTTARVLVFGDSNGTPGEFLFESTDLDCSTTGRKTYVLDRTSFSFTQGTLYWMGVHTSGTCNLSGAHANNTVPIYVPGAGATVPIMGVWTDSVGYGSVSSFESDIFNESNAGLVSVFITAA